MAGPIFGLEFIKVSDEPVPVARADLSKIGIVGPMPDGDDDTFPINVPVKMFSNQLSLIAKIGEGGFIADAIRGINSQLAPLQRAAELYIVRTAEGENADAAIKNQLTMANIMGSSASKTGIWAFAKAPEVAGGTPRVILAPGYTGLRANGVASVTVGTPGTGYTPGETYPATFAGGGAAASIIQATGHAVANEDGEITEVVIDTPGAWYATAPTVTLPDPEDEEGTTALATATLEQLANPVVAAAPALLNMLMAHAIFESPGTSQADDENWRETIQSERIIGIVGGVKVVDPTTGNVVVRPFAPRVAGALVRRDFETGAPMHSAANQPIWDIVGPNRAIDFYITDGANEGQSLLTANLGILVRGETGSDFAIASGGFVFIGTDNLGEDPLWRFYNVTRGRDFIHLSLIPPLRQFLGRYNITGHTIQAVYNTIGFFLRDLKADEHILGYRVDFPANQNSAEDIRLGNVTISMRAEEPSPLRKITTLSGRYRPALDALVLDLESQLNLAA